MPGPSERGYTLIELLTVLALGAILLTLGAGAFRQFWMVQGLNGAVDEISSQLKRAQSRSVSESHPVVYGAWLTRGTSGWRIVRFDPLDATITTDDACTVQEDRTLGGGPFSSTVRIGTATSFADSYEASVCRTRLGAAAATNQFAFFYARGTATPGQVIIEHPVLGRSRTVTVSGLTARVDES